MRNGNGKKNGNGKTNGNGKQERQRRYYRDHPHFPVDDTGPTPPAGREDFISPMSKSRRASQSSGKKMAAREKRLEGKPV
jgi:hypothetical protein